MPSTVLFGFQVPASWAICDSCHGSGGTSAYLGAFTRSEFDEQFDPEEQEAYFNGAYDRPCPHCSGSGKVLVPSLRGVSFATRRQMVPLRREAREEARALAEERAAIRAEMRLCGEW